MAKTNKGSSLVFILFLVFIVSICDLYTLFLIKSNMSLEDKMIERYHEKRLLTEEVYKKRVTNYFLFTINDKGIKYSYKKNNVTHTYYIFLDKDINYILITDGNY